MIKYLSHLYYYWWLCIFFGTYYDWVIYNKIYGKVQEANIENIFLLLYQFY